MAKVISDEILKLKIVINGDEGQASILKLEQANKVLGERIKDLIVQEKQLSAERNKQEKEINSYADKIDSLKGKLIANQSTVIEQVKALKLQQSAFSESSKEYAKYEIKIQSLREKSKSNTNSIQAEIAALQSKQSKLVPTYDQTQKKLKEVTAELRNNKQALADNKMQIDHEIKSMGIMNLTMDQLRKRAIDLRFTLSHMNPNSKVYETTNAQLQAINRRMSELRTGASASGMSIQELAGKFNHYSGILTAAAASLAGIAISIQSTIDMNNKLADAQTAVAKTTGLANEEVKELTKSFSEFDTRTSKIDLLKIAEIGGRLGVPKEEIKDFTREVDRAYVALGDSFSGGVEAVANSLGKIKNLFKETKDLDMATAMNQIGSALNELGAAGAASEENVSDFALRVGALPDNLKPTIAETLALGAAFEESGITAERAGTAYSSFVRVAAKDSDKFAKVMGKTTEEVKKLINTNPMEFFLQFSEGAKGLDATQLAKILDDLKLNDQYVVSVVGAASENTDRFRKSIELSNQSLKEATSLTDEFNKVNNNSAAIYDKVKKHLLGIFTSEAVANGLNWIISGIGKMLGVVEDASGWWQTFGQILLSWAKVIGIATAATISYNAGIALTNLLTEGAITRLSQYVLVQKINSALTATGTMLQNIWNLAVGYGTMALGNLTRSTTLQTAAQERLNLVTKANAWGAVLAVIVAVGAAYMAFSKSIDEAKEKQKELNRIQTETNAGIRSEKNELETLLRIAKDEHASKEAREKAIKRLNQISPEYLGNLNLENINTMAATKAVNAYSDALLRNSKIKVLNKKLEALQEEKDKMGDQSLLANGNWLQRNILPYTSEGNMIEGFDKNMMKQYEAWVKSGGKAFADKMMKDYGYLYENKNQKTRTVDDKIQDVINEITTEQNKEFTTAPDKVTTSNYKGLPEKEKKEKKPKLSKEERAFNSAKDAILKASENFNDRMTQLTADGLRSRAELMEEGFEKEVAIIRAENRQKLAELEKQKHSEKDFAKLDDIIAKTKGNEKAKFQAIKAQWLKENAALSELQSLENEKTVLKLKTADEKAKSDQLKRDEEAFSRSVDLLKRTELEKLGELDTVAKQRAFLQGKISNEEMAKLTTYEEGRSLVQRYFQEESLKQQEEYLQGLIAQLDALPTAELTMEQVKALEAMRNKLAEIAATKADITNDKNKANVLGDRLASFGGGKDLLGLSSDQWKAMFANADTTAQKIQKIGAAIEVTKQLFSAYYSFISANEAAKLRKMEVSSERAKAKLKNQLDTGVINQEDYKRQTLRIDAELDKRKAETEYNQAKRQRNMQVAETIANTAKAIMGIWADFPKVDFGATAAIMSGVVGGLGALQVATILRQPLPSATGAEDGFYPVRRKQDGRVFSARKKQSQSGIFDEPTMLVGEAGATMPELVVTSKAMRRVDPRIKDEFVKQVYQAEGFENGLYPTSPNEASKDYSAEIVQALNRYSDIMEDIKKNGIEAFFRKTAQNGKDLEEVQELYKKLVNKNKH